MEHQVHSGECKCLLLSSNAYPSEDIDVTAICAFYAGMQILSLRNNGVFIGEKRAFNLNLSLKILEIQKHGKPTI